MSYKLKGERDPFALPILHLSFYLLICHFKRYREGKAKTVLGFVVIIMAGLKNIVAVALVMIVSMSLEGKWVGAQVHHVVGGDRGWDPATNLSSWRSGRIFRVGDKICKTPLYCTFNFSDFN